jgi:hypothetical protein
MQLCAYTIKCAGIVVARVRMSKMTGPAYGAAIRAFIECCNKENGGNLIDKLKGIVVDWSSAQINGIKFAFGEERGKELLRGCQVLL